MWAAVKRPIHKGELDIIMYQTLHAITQDFATFYLMKSYIFFVAIGEHKTALIDLENARGKV